MQNKRANKSPITLVLFCHTSYKRTTPHDASPMIGLNGVRIRNELLEFTSSFKHNQKNKTLRGRLVWTKVEHANKSKLKSIVFLSLIIVKTRNLFQKPTRKVRVLLLYFGLGGTSELSGVLNRWTEGCVHWESPTAAPLPLTLRCPTAQLQHIRHLTD